MAARGDAAAEAAEERAAQAWAGFSHNFAAEIIRYHVVFAVFVPLPRPQF
jgi:hypothetical protein